LLSELLGRSDANEGENTKQVLSFFGSLIFFGAVFFVAGGLATTYPVLVWVALILLIFLYFGLGND